MAGDTEDGKFADANRDYFDKFAARYNKKPWQQAMTRQITAELREQATFIGLAPIERDDAGKPKKEVRMLDYACGPGMVSKALAPYITHATGIDIAPSMIEAYNTAAAADPPPNEPKLDAQGYTGDLLSDTPTPALAGPAFTNFNLAAVGLGFHHFAEPARATQRLADRLAPGGVLLVVDFCAHEHTGGHSHAHAHAHGSDGESWVPSAAAHTVRTHGFTPDGMRDMFAAAGLTAFGWREAAALSELRFPVSDDEGAEERVAHRRVFYARAQKPAE